MTTVPAEGKSFKTNSHFSDGISQNIFCFQLLKCENLLLYRNETVNEEFWGLNKQFVSRSGVFNLENNLQMNH